MQRYEEILIRQTKSMIFRTSLIQFNYIPLNLFQLIVPQNTFPTNLLRRNMTIPTYFFQEPSNPHSFPFSMFACSYSLMSLPFIIYTP